MSVSLCDNLTLDVARFENQLLKKTVKTGLRFGVPIAKQSISYSKMCSCKKVELRLHNLFVG